MRESPEFLSEQLLTYLGNKRLLVPKILGVVQEVRSRTGRKLRCFDVFSGSGVVSRALKAFSSHLHVGDLEPYCEVISKCYLTNVSEVDLSAVQAAVDHVNFTAAESTATGFISDMYAPKDSSHIQAGERVFYTRRNAQFIDASRQEIDRLPTELQALVLAPLLYKASVHTNTSGVFKGFYKNKATGIGQFGGTGRNALARIMGDIKIPHPVFSRFECPVTVHRGDANSYARIPRDLDLAYVDPPYNQHPYGSNYFMLNLITSYVRPAEVSKVSGIPANWQRSLYNKRKHAKSQLRELIKALDARFVLLSFNSEGFVSEKELHQMLSEFGSVRVIQVPHNAFRGSRNLRQRDLYVTEFLFLLEKR